MKEGITIKSLLGYFSMQGSRNRFSTYSFVLLTAPMMTLHPKTSNRHIKNTTN